MADVMMLCSRSDEQAVLVIRYIAVRTILLTIESWQLWTARKIPKLV